MDAVVPQDVIKTPSVSTPNETVTILDAIAAGSEDWNLPTQEPKQLNHLDSMEDK